MINHDVEAENLEAELVVHVVRVARSEQMMNMGLCQAQRLTDDIVNFALDSFACHQTESHLQNIEDMLIRAFATDIISSRIGVLHKCD